MAKEKENKEKRAKYDSLISALSRGYTLEARRLLKKYSGQDAKSISDLEMKLAQFYIKSNDKLTLEKEFAEIHPHKDFILKYIRKEEPVVVEEEPKIVIGDMYSSADGERKSNCEGTNCNCGGVTQKMSGADGSQSTQSNGNNSIMILGLVTIVVMVSLVVINNKK